MKHVTLIALAFLTCTSSVCQTEQPRRKRIDLSGKWDTNLGKCVLPGTTDENRLGTRNTDTTCTSQLTREYSYRGKVEYTKSIDIPDEFTEGTLCLHMERTKCSTLIVDKDTVGHINQLYAPHRYDISGITSGKHLFKIIVDNSDNTVPDIVHGSHAWSDATQTNWNGILGDFYLESRPETYIEDIKVYPDVDNKCAKIDIYIVSPERKKIKIGLSTRLWNDGPTRNDEISQTISAYAEEGRNVISTSLDLGDTPQLWNEFHPSLYQLTVSIAKKKGGDTRVTQFGMRKFETEGRRFKMNDRYVFLRGTHDACVFPLTGYAPTNVEQWRELFLKAKSYGINHYRFHSYTPPEAAFIAADIEGMYLQCELPAWGSIDRNNESTNKFLLNEAFTTLDHFGNHPSFMMLGLGNEMWGDVDVMREWLDSLRHTDPRRLYCFGANNWLGWRGAQDGEDYMVTCRVGGGDRFDTHTRSSFSFADAEDGGILNGTRPGTSKDYTHAVTLCPRPIISHESAQFQIYPDYSDIVKYKGILKPYNMQVFRERIKNNGMLQHVKEFHETTGKWAVNCYKADMEYCLRTPEFGGFEILDIKDYPGQGTALVGILDAFMDGKGLISPEDFRDFCSPFTLLARMDSLCFDSEQGLDIIVNASNYTENDMMGNVKVRLTEAGSEEEIMKKVFHGCIFTQGDVTDVGKLHVQLPNISVPTKINMTLTCDKYQNTYSLWAFPKIRNMEEHDEIIHVEQMNSDVMDKLCGGACVLLTPRHKDIEKQSVGGLFTPDYWNYAMFKTISENNNKPVSPGTLGMCMDADHPLFNEFPTDGQTDWQWWTIARNSRPLILNRLPDTYRPIIQVVDNVERNHKLGILMEFKVGDGKLLICTTDMSETERHIEGRWFEKAIYDYMMSEEFNPDFTLSQESLNSLLHEESTTRNIQGVKNETDYKIPQ